MRDLIAASVLVCAGCGSIPQPFKTYAGPELPPQAVAQVAGESCRAPDQPGGVYIPCMDGVSLERSFGAYDNDARWPDRLTVVPGPHHLAVVYSLCRGKGASWAIVTLEAEAGRQYKVNNELSGESVRMWVEDAANGAVVATAAPMRGAGRDAVKPCP